MLIPKAWTLPYCMNYSKTLHTYRVFYKLAIGLWSTKESMYYVFKFFNDTCNEVFTCVLMSSLGLYGMDFKSCPPIGENLVWIKISFRGIPEQSIPYPTPASL